MHDPGNIIAKDAVSGEEFVYRQIWNASELLGAHLIEQTAEGRLAQGEPVAIVGGAQPLVLACIIACAKSKHPHYFIGEDVLCFEHGAAISSAGATATAPADAAEVVATAGAVAAAEVGTAAAVGTAADAGATTGAAEVGAVVAAVAGAVQLSPVVLSASNALAEAAKLRFAGTTRVFSAELMLSYIVPGMSDDFSCGCGAEDCAHGPFLQECMPAEWFASEGVFALALGGATAAPAPQATPATSPSPQTTPTVPATPPVAPAPPPVWQQTVAEHDAMLTEALMATSTVPAAGSGRSTAHHPHEKSNRSAKDPWYLPPLNLCNPHLAATLALGGQIQ